MAIHVRRPSRFLPTRRFHRWVYLGQDESIRSHMESLLGRERRVRLGSRVNQAAQDIRPDFLQWSAEIGQAQTEKLKWWACRISCRSPFATDAHLLISYAVVFREMVSQWMGTEGEDALFLIEDFWLYRALKKNYCDEAGLRFGPDLFQGLFLKKIALIVRGICARMALLARIVRQRSWLRRRHIASHATERKGADEAAWIYSLIESQLFDKGGDDPYIPGLAGILADHERPVRRLFGFLIPRDLESKVSGLKDAVFLLGLLRAGDLCKALISFPWLNAARLRRIRDMDFGLILEREIWMELGSANFVLMLLHYYSFLYFFRMHRGQRLFYFYEGQAREQMLCMARNDCGLDMALVGCQHSTIPKLLLSHFPHASDWNRLPLPDRIVTNGPFHHKIMEDAGYPKSMLVEGGSFRFNGLKQKRAHSDYGEKLLSRIFVALPFRKTVAKEMMDLLIQYGEQWATHAIAFYIRPHPDTPFEAIGRYPREGHHLESAFAALTGMVDEVDAVLYSYTTAGLEALLLGLPVLTYVPEMSINLDATLDWFPETLVSCDSGNFLERALGFAEGRLRAKSMIASREIFFSPVNENLWLTLARSDALDRVGAPLS